MRVTHGCKRGTNSSPCVAAGGGHGREEGGIREWRIGFFGDARVGCRGLRLPSRPRRVQASFCILQAIDKEELSEGESDKNRVVRPRHIHDPGTQQEPSAIVLSYQWLPTRIQCGEAMARRRKEARRGAAHPVAW
jgi:hypothetical protein